MSNIKFRGLGRISIAVTGLVLVGGALLGGAKPAFATGSGLSFYPSTDIYSKGTIHFDADDFVSTNGRNNAGSSAGLEFGVGPEKETALGRTELGFDYANAGAGISTKDRLYLNFKTQLYSNPGSGTRVTFGGYGISTSDAAGGDWLNLLASKSFPFGRITVGGAYATRKNFAHGGKGGYLGDRSVFQLGYDKALNDKFIVCADYQSGKGQFISPGVIYMMNDKSDFEVSYGHGGSAFKGTGARDQIYIGFDYNFGHPYVAPTTDAAPAGGGAGGGGGAG